MLLAGKSKRALQQTYFVSDGCVYSHDDLKQTLEKALQCRAVSVSVFAPLVWLLALGAEWKAYLTGVPAILNRNRLPELQQSNWSCCCEKLKNELRYRPRHTLAGGVKHTVVWARQNGCLVKRGCPTKEKE